MAGIKNLAKDTAIYGTSSILGRLLNWLLVPMYTRIFLAEEYGVVTFDYSFVALMLAFLTYGMETGFFRFVNHEREYKPMEVYSTTLISLMVTSTLFVVLVSIFLKPLAYFMQDQNPSYAMLLCATVAIDAFTAIPFGYLRYKQRPIRFAFVRFLNIGLNIGLNLFFLLLCPWLMKECPGVVDWFYVPDFGVGYIFLSNFIASFVTLFLLLPELTGFKWIFIKGLWREMMKYSWPLLLLSVVGIMNQNLPNIMFPFLASDASTADAQLGIYGACYKIGMIMIMFLQAFRFAYEPFIFSLKKDENAGKVNVYSIAMRYFLIITLFIFMAVMFYLHFIKLFIGKNFYEGLGVVPIIMLAELFFGVVFNLSVWYKLTDRTIWGTYLSLIGFVVMLAMNIILVPRYSYYGCAWGAFASYGLMMVVSYFVGQKYSPIDYGLKRIGFYAALAAVFYLAGYYGLGKLTQNIWILTTVRTLILAAYLIIVVKVEKLPVVATVRRLACRFVRR